MNDYANAGKNKFTLSQLKVDVHRFGMALHRFCTTLVH